MRRRELEKGKEDGSINQHGVPMVRIRKEEKEDEGDKKEKNRDQFRGAARMRRRELYGDDPHGFKEKAAGMPPEQRKEYERGMRTLKMFQKARHVGDRANERTLTKPEKKEKEKVVKGMKKNKSDFKSRYGKDAESVMYATATKIAKEKA
jgi:hypothetical protein